MVYDVAIVGYGPSGATLANLLVGCGITVAVIDREATLYPLPRAIHFDDEIMRVFQTIGVADRLRDFVLINPGMRFQDNEGNLLLDWPRDQNITHHGWNASYRLHQPDLETLLRENFSTNKHSTEILKCNVLGVNEHEDHVEVLCEGDNPGQKRSIQARYVVGCDGANSLLRQVIGAGMQDFGFNERWLVVDLLLKKPRPDLGDHSIQFCNPERPATYCRNPGARRRWEFTLHQHETDEEVLRPEALWRLLSRWVTPEDADLERCAVYTFRSALAQQWRQGRLLLAGDAAHLTPPFMGQGMCTGIRDTSNLAWKLDAVLQHGVDDSILDAYQAEREPHAQTYIETAIRLGGLINSTNRDSALEMAKDQKAGKSTIKSIQPKLGESTQLVGIQDAPVGLPFEQPVLETTDKRFDDLAGYRHALISRTTLPLTDAANAVNLSADVHPALHAVLDRMNTNAVWVRPDRYVGAIADTNEGLLTKIAGTAVGIPS